MKKIHIILVLLFAFVALTCTCGVASVYLSTEYVGNTIVDLSWTEYKSTDFSKYELYRDGSLIETIRAQTTTFYRDEGLTKGYTYNYEIRSYYTTDKYRSDTTSATTGEVEGTITRDTAWTAASSPYTLTKSVGVLNGATLTIERGVKIVDRYRSYYVSYRKGTEVYVDGASFNGVNINIGGSHAEIKNCCFVDAGIHLMSSSNSVITDNTFSNSSHTGISLDKSSNNIVTDNNVSNSSRTGISLFEFSNNNIITGNTVLNGRSAGISLSESSNNTITGNNVTNNRGNSICLADSSNNTITGNIASDNHQVGICLFYSSNNNNITGNNVSNSSHTGIYLHGSKYLHGSNKNTIYNNYFNNTNNSYDDGNNIWNISKTMGTNIVGDPYLGGNYWSDYKGADSDSDGLGDTPYDIPGGTNRDYLPLTEFKIDLWIEELKIIQTVEDAENIFVASKPAVVRVFVNGSINATKEELVKTKLKLMLDGKEIETRDVTVKEQRWYSLRNRKLGRNSINIHIPSKYFATEGPHTVKAIINPDNNPQESDEFNNSKTKTCDVKMPKDIFEVEFVALNVGEWDSMDAAELHLYRASATANSNFLRAAYPFSKRSYKAHFVGEYEPGLEGTIICNWIFKDLHRRAVASKNLDRVVGIFPQGWLGAAGASTGQGWDGVIVGGGTEYEWVSAHEIMHTFGQYYTEDYDANPPWGSLADDGWWVDRGMGCCRDCFINLNKTDRGNTLDIVDGTHYGNHIYSYMGEAYLPVYWTTKTDYEFLYGELVSSTTTSSLESHVDLKASSNPSKLILLSGLIWSNGSVTMDPIYSDDFLDPEEEEVSSPKYYLEFYHDTSLLKTYRFDTIEFTDSLEIQDGFVVTVEMPDSTTAIYIKRNDETTIATLSPSDNAPSVELTYPNGGELLTGNVEVTWNAEDVDGDSLAYILYFSDNSGLTWRTIAMDIEGSSYHWDSSDYPGSDSCMLKIVASDGFNSAEDTTDSVFSLSDKAPFVAIINPENNSTFEKDEEIYFYGIAYDPQGNKLDYSDFIWTSDIDGYIGTGSTLSLSILSSGTHEIKLKVENSAGLIGTSESKFIGGVSTSVKIHLLQI